MTSEIRLLTFESNSVHSQDQCSLFSIIPAETRDLIFSFALAPFEDPDPAARYEEDTCFKRPNYSAPHKSDTALLRTCKRIYSEAWFRPWSASQQTFYFTWSERRPDGSDEGVQTVGKMQHALNLLHELHGDVDLEGGIRIFAQLWALEGGGNFNRIMAMHHFHPHIITVTVRHTDWWNWESDAVMHINSNWVKHACLPRSVREVRLEFESLERRKEQVDALADQACDLWFFAREDGQLLTASRAGFSVDRWTGSSTWDGRRWEEDETPGKEGTLDYYVKTILFRPTQTSRRDHSCDLDRKDFMDRRNLPEFHQLMAPTVGLRIPRANDQSDGADGDEDEGQEDDEAV